MYYCILCKLTKTANEYVGPISYWKCGFDRENLGQFGNENMWIGMPVNI
jgi:hypothetical protein